MDTNDRTLALLVEKGKTPSAQYLLFNQDEIIHAYCVGYADLANQIPASETTIYNGFSTTKTFTALAVLQLVEKGVVDLDGSAAKYISNFPYSEEISVRQLLAHTAGIPNPNPLPWIHTPEEHLQFNRDAFFRQVFDKHSKLKTKPGQKFAYTNLGYVLLGQLIEEQGGQTYEAYLRDHVFEPLELGPRELGFDIPEYGSRAKGYHKKNSLLNWVMGFFIDKKTYRGDAEGKWQPFKPYHINGSPHGGLMGQPGAYMKYLQELLREDCRLLSPEYKAMLFKENYTNNGHASGMCLSWFTGKLLGNTYFAHAGGGGGYYCEIRLYPEAGVGSIVMFNRSGMKDERFLDKLDQYYLSPL
jgi:CubicO group peptidase (beta-lactamase class C family)